MQVTICLTIICVVSVFGQEKYTDKYDNVDLDNIIKNERLLKNYVDCLLDKIKCGKDAAELKKLIPDALENECEKCSEKHRNGIRKVIKHLTENKKDWWNELLDKYDHEGTYRKKYEELRQEEHINF